MSKHPIGASTHCRERTSEAGAHNKLQHFRRLSENRFHHFRENSSLLHSFIYQFIAQNSS